MPSIEYSSAARCHAAEIQPRHPHREIAELLATAMLRMRAGLHEPSASDLSEIGLGFTGHQRVHTNPSDTEGVRN